MYIHKRAHLDVTSGKYSKVHSIKDNVAICARNILTRVATVRTTTSDFDSADVTAWYMDLVFRPADISRRYILISQDRANTEEFLARLWTAIKG